VVVPGTTRQRGKFWLSVCHEWCPASPDAYNSAWRVTTCVPAVSAAEQPWRHDQCLVSFSI
jgi:hypothetical protein